MARHMATGNTTPVSLACPICPGSSLPTEPGGIPENSSRAGRTLHQRWGSQGMSRPPPNPLDSAYIFSPLGSGNNQLTS